MKIKLIVIRSKDPDKLITFYQLLGLEFDYHKHGNSPFHYSTTINETVLEIYPLLKSQTEPDNSLRLGFEVNDFENVLKSFDNNNIEYSTHLETEFGYMTIVKDFEGRKIELYKKIE